MHASAATVAAAPAAYGGLGELAPALELLDARLREALAEAERRFGHEAAADPYRGLYLIPDDVASSLGRTAGEPAFPPRAPDTAQALAAACPRLAALAA